MLNMKVFPRKVQPTNQSRSHPAMGQFSGYSNARSTFKTSSNNMTSFGYQSNRFPPVTKSNNTAFLNPPAMGNNDLVKVGYITMDRKTNRRKCSICHVTFTSRSHERDHMVGKKHAKMLTKLQAPLQGDGQSPVKSNPAPAYTPLRHTPVQPKIYSSVIDSSSAASKVSAKNKYITIDKETKERKCAVCHVSFTSPFHERDHLKGKKHAKMVVKVFGEFGRCELCNMKYESARDGINHLFSQIHIKKQLELDIKSGRVPKGVVKPVKRSVPVVKPPAALPKVVTTEASEEDGDMQCIYTRKAESKAAKMAAERLQQPSVGVKRVSIQPKDIPSAKKQRKESTQKTKRFCTNCGDPTAPENNFCGACGAKLK